jgi:hypothetical protein
MMPASSKQGAVPLATCSVGATAFCFDSAGNSYQVTVTACNGTVATIVNSSGSAGFAGTALVANATYTNVPLTYLASQA